MLINADFDKDAMVKSADRVWHPSPMAGVERVMLDRMGAESGHATSIVRYAPNSRFSAHTHSGGEEFLVLQGVFNDEDGAYPVGTYARNPIGTQHTPWAGPDGTTIFVKLHQFDEDDTRQFRAQAFAAGDLATAPTAFKSLTLHEFGDEVVTVYTLPAGDTLTLPNPERGAELLILAGSVVTDHGPFDAGGWLRLHGRDRIEVSADGDGAILYCKTGHL
ncbi:hypothetical protein ACMU_16400 [Actibacterium mucosum KCTC 23349]|uniref:ChrR-like cupin domain-containing protein n=1 Tax=Actibacterium mucosum KCTC 23349 TaxID=1454373 RepID=A0A037ZIM9_9RHOB|nr:cupin domain-containing protein [Actibacterium mucosum]KAJ54695.1 hypothetical protein ACMU_16400 [Actibacterium mucosum KCTC 23349]